MSNCNRVSSVANPIYVTSQCDEVHIITAGSPGPEGPEGPEGPANTDASLLSTGTVPLGRLSGLTSAQLSATAGILSSQIAGLDASKITGTFPLSLLNQGTTGQFLRGDGTYSNTLTGGLTIAGALAGATTGSFSGDLIGTAAAATGSFFRTDSVSGSDNKVAGIHAANSFSTSRTGYILVRGINHASNGGGVEIRPCTAGGQTRLLFANGNTALSVDSAMVLGAFTGTTAAFSSTVATGALTVTGAMAASGAVSGTTGTFSGDLSIFKSTGNASFYLRPASGSTNSFIYFQNDVGANLGSIRGLVGSGLIHNCDTQTFRNLDASLTFLTLNSSGATLGGANKIIYGAAGTTTAANNEIVGAVGGLRLNSPSGSAIVGCIAGSAVSTQTNTTFTWSGSGGIVFGSVSGALNTGFPGIGSITGTLLGYSLPTNGRHSFRFNGAERVAFQDLSGFAGGILGIAVGLGNSTTTTLMTATSRYGWLRIVDNTGQYAVIRIANSATPVIESSSANFAVTASPTTSQLGINLSAGTLSIITGSAAGTTISASFQGQ